MKQTFIVCLIYKYKKQIVLFNCSYLKYFLVNVLYATVQCETFSFKSPCNIKVENILKGSLDSIPSPSHSVKIQIIAGKFNWGNKAKHCWVMSTNCWKQTPGNGLPLYLKQTFPPTIWIFTECEGDGIEYRLPFKNISTLKDCSLCYNLPTYAQCSGIKSPNLHHEQL